MSLYGSQVLSFAAAYKQLLSAALSDDISAFTNSTAVPEPTTFASTMCAVVVLVGIARRDRT